MIRQVDVGRRRGQSLCLLAGMVVALLVGSLLFLAVADPAQAAFPGTNGKIVFSGDAPHSATSEDYDTDLFSMDPSGANQTNLTNTTADIEILPAVSPDGTKVAFSRDYGAFGGDVDIWVMNADGTNQTRLTTNSAVDKQPAWSPDGTKIAFVSTRSGNQDVWVMKANGTSQTNLTKTAAYEYFPAWSPDGNKIAYSGVVTNSQLELFKMNPDGTNRVRLTRTGSKDDYWPDWSPDGTKIAFQREAGNRELYEASAEIYKMKADGSNAVRLTTNTTEDFQPAWSPDGTKIAFESTRNGNFEIYIMTADGSNVANRTNKPTDEYDASWGVALSE